MTECKCHGAHPYEIVEGCECPYCIREQMKDDSGFTPEEFAVAEHLIEAWNKFIALPKQHPSDIPEFHQSIHRLQYLLGIRITRRKHSKYWFNMEVTNDKP